MHMSVLFGGRKLFRRRPLPKGNRHEVFKSDNFKCAECGAGNEKTVLHVDHILPISKGGTDELSNLRTLCAQCNREKSDLIHKNNAKNLFSFRPKVPNLLGRNHSDLTTLCLICMQNTKDYGCKIKFEWNNREEQGYSYICLKCWDIRFDFGYCSFDKIKVEENVK